MNGMLVGLAALAATAAGVLIGALLVWALLVAATSGLCRGRDREAGRAGAPPQLRG